MAMKTMSVLLFLGLVSCIAALSIQPVTPENCIKFCPEGKFGNYICCDPHPGRCPAVRPECPGLRKGFGPVICEHDGHCDLHQKCCEDACFPFQKVCKAAQF